ncbi:hypothetical protein ACFFNY_09395 [Paenibacillus hodogayensis]|uniref:Uncharacterized protein n=1 Tax=Paenibacillus hodogayensis TaxID=279208 RepID=A0ABV5VU12_9BACL
MMRQGGLESVQYIQMAKIPVEADKIEPLLVNRQPDEAIVAKIVDWIRTAGEGKSVPRPKGRRLTAHGRPYRWGSDSATGRRHS